jgi:hypothetical protein
MWKVGQLPIPADQLPDGTIIVDPSITAMHLPQTEQLVAFCRALKKFVKSW